MTDSERPSITPADLHPVAESTHDQLTALAEHLGELAQQATDLPVETITTTLEKTQESLQTFLNDSTE